jgi:hypothetical protein
MLKALDFNAAGFEGEVDPVYTELISCLEMGAITMGASRQQRVRRAPWMMRACCCANGRPTPSRAVARCSLRNELQGLELRSRVLVILEPVSGICRLPVRQ